MKLNFGCGGDILKGWRNFDIYPISKEVEYIDLKELPLIDPVTQKQFPDNYADEIKLSHVVEHLVYRNEFMFEIHRILKPSGKVTVILPCFGVGLDHKSWFHTKTTMVGLCNNVGKIKHGTPRPFNLISFKYGWGTPIIFLKRLWMLLKCMYHSNCKWEMKKR